MPMDGRPSTGKGIPANEPARRSVEEEVEEAQYSEG